MYNIVGLTERTLRGAVFLWPRLASDDLDSVCTDAIVSLQENRHKLTGGVVLSDHPLGILIRSLLHHRLGKVTERVTLTGWALGGINHDRTPALVFIPLVGRRPENVQVLLYPR